MYSVYYIVNTEVKEHTQALYTLPQHPQNYALWKTRSTTF